MTRVSAWFCLLGGGALTLELLLSGERINFLWLLLFALSARYFHRHGLLRPKEQEGQVAVATHAASDDES